MTTLEVGVAASAFHSVGLLLLVVLTGVALASVGRWWKLERTKTTSWRASSAHC